MKLKVLGYLIFIIVCILFCLYIHFPGKTASKYIEHRVSQIHPDIKVQIDPVRPGFPLGLKTKVIQANYAGNPIMTLENFRSYFDVTTLFGKVFKGSFRTSVFDGVLSGNVSMPRGIPGDLVVEADLETLKLKQIELDKFLSDGLFSGTINGKITAEFKDGNIQTNYGRINLADLVLQFPESLFSIETFAFSTGQIKFALEKDNIIKFEECMIKGRQIDIHSSGEIQINKDFQKSGLNLDVKVVMYPLFFMDAGDTVPVGISKNSSGNAIFHLQVKGTIEKPIIVKDRGVK